MARSLLSLLSTKDGSESRSFGEFDIPPHSHLTGHGNGLVASPSHLPCPHLFLAALLSITLSCSLSMLLTATPRFPLVTTLSSLYCTLVRYRLVPATRCDTCGKERIDVDGSDRAALQPGLADVAGGGRAPVSE